MFGRTGRNPHPPFRRKKLLRREVTCAVAREERVHRKPTSLRSDQRLHVDVRSGSGRSPFLCFSSRHRVSCGRGHTELPSCPCNDKRLRRQNVFQNDPWTDFEGAYVASGALQRCTVLD